MQLPRRPTWISVLFVLALIPAAGGIGAYRWWQREKQRAQLNKIMPAINQAMSQQITKSLLDNPFGGFELKHSANCAEDMITLTLSFRAKGPDLLRNLRFSEITLGGSKPDDSVPITITELQPGTEKAVSLRFRKVPWNRLGDGGRYETGLNIREEYEGPPDAGKRWTTTYTGIPVTLDAESVRELERQRRAK